MSKTKIEWADKVWNPVTGCTKVSEGCRNCYAEGVAKRFWGDRKFGDVVCHMDRLENPRHWRKPQRIFVNSMSDLFHRDVPQEFIISVFATMARARQHTFMILTKRPDRMYRLLFAWINSRLCLREGHGSVLPNVWLGVSVEDQQTADERIPLLLKTPASKRFVSCEPMLGTVSFRWAGYCYQATGETYRQYLERNGSIDHLESLKALDWVICGGESGHKARPLNPDWVRTLRDQCKDTGTPFFFKQWGTWCAPSQMPDDVWRAWDYHHGTENCWDMDKPEWKVGKKSAGNLLDDERWEQFPGDDALGIMRGVKSAKKA